MQQEIKLGMHAHGYTFAAIENERAAKEKAHTFQVRGEFVPKKPRTYTKKKEDKVPLRIDSRTVIYVTKDKANQKYAEQWKERYRESLIHAGDMHNLH